MTIIALAMATVLAGCGEQEKQPYFLKATPVAPSVAGTTSEQSLGVPQYPVATLLPAKTLRAANRLCLWYETAHAVTTVVNFYEARLRMRAVKGHGTSGVQYSLGTAFSDGRRTTVIIEARRIDGKENGTIIRLLHEQLGGRGS